MSPSVQQMRNAYRTPLGKLKSFITLFFWREWFTFGNELTRTRTKEMEAHFLSHMWSKVIMLKLPLRKPTSAIENATDIAIVTETAAVENCTTVATGFVGRGNMPHHNVW